MQHQRTRLTYCFVAILLVSGCGPEYYQLKEFTECYAYRPDGHVFLHRNELIDPTIDNGTKVRVLRDQGETGNYHRPVEVIVVEGPKSGLSGTVARQYLRVP